MGIIPSGPTGSQIAYEVWEAWHKLPPTAFPNLIAIKFQRSILCVFPVILNSIVPGRVRCGNKIRDIFQRGSRPWPKADVLVGCPHTRHSWLVLQVPFQEGDQKPRTLNIMRYLRKICKIQKRVPSCWVLNYPLQNEHWGNRPFIMWEQSPV